MAHPLRIQGTIQVNRERNYAHILINEQEVTIYNHVLQLECLSSQLILRCTFFEPH